MGTVRDVNSTCQDTAYQDAIYQDRTYQDVIDIDAELRHWRGCYRESAFHRTGREFDDYIPTLKFGYDTYLLNYHKTVASPMGSPEHMPSFEQRYRGSVPQWQQLDWPLSEAIIRETWKRAQQAGSCQPLPIARPA